MIGILLEVVNHLHTVGGESFAYYWSVVKVHFLHFLFSNLCMLSSMCGV